MRLTILFSLISFVCSAQLGPAQSALFYRNPSGPELSGLFVEYNTTTYSYWASKAGYSDTGSFITGSNVIGCADVNGTNSGLGYDAETDRFLMLTDSLRFFTRAAFTTAAAAAAGTIPVYDETLPFIPSGQGVSIDTETQEFYTTVVGDHDVQRRQYDGTVIETIDLEAAGVTPECSINYYDPVDDILYVTGDGANVIYGLKSIEGTWTLVYTSWFASNEGMAVDFITEKIVCNGPSTFFGATIREQTHEEGTDVVEHPYPVANMNSVEEGFLVDPRDGTFWLNSDQLTHGSITDGNRLWHTDPRGWYKKYYRTPQMNYWSELWSVRGNAIEGRLAGETLKGYNFSIGPVTDYGAFTGQQTLGNWTFKPGENAHLQFRGSSSAPTTTPEATVEYHDLVLYSAKGTNDGWGSTTPGAWQDTPTTDRYMQVRARPLAVAEDNSFTPFSLGTALISWLHTGPENVEYDLSNQYEGMYVRWYTSQQVDRVIDLASPGTRFLNVGSFPPLWNTTSDYMDMIAGNRHINFTAYADWESLLASGQFEVHVIGARPATGNRAVYVGVSNTGSNNNQLILQHSGSGNTPANYLSVTYTDNAGTVNRHGVTDTSAGTFRMLSFRLGGSTNEIYVNKVLQTLTDNAGSNTGQSFDDTNGLANTMRVGRVQATSSVQGVTWVKDIIITTHLTTQQRSDLYDYFQSIGQIP